MSHPGPLLADYVDGTLDPSTRAEVDAHLRTCVTCSDEVALAQVGARAANALGEPPAPTGLADAANAEAARLAGDRSPEVASIAGRRRRPAARRVLAVAGAAAVLLLLVVVAPKLGQSPSSDLAAGAASASPATKTYPAATGVETQHANYTFDAVSGALSSLRSAFATSDGASAAPGPVQPSSAGAEATALPSIAAQADASADPSKLPKATACLDKASPPTTGTLSRVILAKYEGQPAYLGVYLIGPGAGLPPTLLQVTVASVDGCALLDQATARL